MSEQDYCKDCALAHFLCTHDHVELSNHRFLALQAENEVSESRTELAKKIRADDKRKVKTPGFWVSRKWFSDFNKAKSFDDVDPTVRWPPFKAADYIDFFEVNSAVECPHGKLSLELAKKKALSVTPKVRLCV